MAQPRLSGTVSVRTPSFRLEDTGCGRVHSGMEGCGFEFFDVGDVADGDGGGVGRTAKCDRQRIAGGDLEKVDLHAGRRGFHAMRREHPLFAAHGGQQRAVIEVELIGFGAGIDAVIVIGDRARWEGSEVEVALHEGVRVRLAQCLVVAPGDDRFAQTEQRGAVEGVAVVPELGVDPVEFAPQLQPHGHQVAEDDLVRLVQQRAHSRHEVGPGPVERPGGLAIVPADAVVGFAL
jgi:hypothetical protein